jgi:hypothetical protein
MSDRLPAKANVAKVCLQSKGTTPILSAMLFGSACWMLFFGWYAWTRWRSVRRALRVGEIRTGFARGFGRTVYRSMDLNDFQAAVRGRTAAAIAYSVLALVPVAGWGQLWLAGYPLRL